MCGARLRRCLVDVIGVLVEDLLAIHVLDSGGNFGGMQSSVDQDSIRTNVGISLATGKLALAEAGIRNGYSFHDGEEKMVCASINV